MMSITTFDGNFPAGGKFSPIASRFNRFAEPLEATLSASETISPIKGMENG